MSEDEQRESPEALPAVVLNLLHQALDEMRAVPWGTCNGPRLGTYQTTGGRQAFRLKQELVQPFEILLHHDMVRHNSRCISMLRFQRSHSFNPLLARDPKRLTQTRRELESKGAGLETSGPAANLQT
jgi:hypothetical protein